MKTMLRLTLAFAVTAGATAVGLPADWPNFRGVNGGVADDGGLPVKWTASDRLWKSKLPGPGASSPITYGDKIFVTCYSGYGTNLTAGMAKGGKGGGKGGADEGGDQKKLRYHLLCMNRDSGKLVWQKDVEPKLPEVPFTGFLREHGYTSSTPATDGERVYAFFGKTGVVAFKLTGEKVWQASVGTDTDKWGSGSSLIVHDGIVIVNASIESQALVGLDAKTGQEVWRQKGLSTCWTSPLLVETKDGKHEVVMSLAGKVVGYDPKSGKELWRCQGIGGGAGGGGKGGKGGGGYTSSTPVARDGVVYVVGGGGPNPAVSLAVKAGGRGDVNESHVLWRKSLGTGIASPVLQGDNLCWIAGSATVLKASDGSTVAQERLYDSRQEYVSPVVAGDKIFALTRRSGLYVLAGSPKFQELAHNEFDGDNSVFNASPAISDNKLYVRSNEYLCCIGKK